MSSRVIVREAHERLKMEDLAVNTESGITEVFYEEPVDAIRTYGAECVDVFMSKKIPERPYSDWEIILGGHYIMRTAEEKAAVYRKLVTSAALRHQFAAAWRKSTSEEYRKRVRALYLDPIAQQDS